MFKKDPNLKPLEVQSALLVSSMRSEKDWEKINKQASQLVNRTWIANQKRAVGREINPMRENFEGLVTFKKFCDKKNKYYIQYIYEINDTRGNPDSPSFVFKTSTTKLQMVHNMDKDGDHFVS